jgi:hypothetical protein
MNATCTAKTAAIAIGYITGLWATNLLIVGQFRAAESAEINTARYARRSKRAMFSGM